jgi:hypothetical protein
MYNEKENNETTNSIIRDVPIPESIMSSLRMPFLLPLCLISSVNPVHSINP